MQREDLRKSLVIDDRNHSERQEENEVQRAGRIERMINEMEHRRKELKVEELSFNSFYEFPCNVFQTSATKTVFRALTFRHTAT